MAIARHSQFNQNDVLKSLFMLIQTSDFFFRRTQKEDVL